MNYKLFCANEDAERQRWEGSRLGPKDQKTLMADCVEPLSNFPSYVREIHTQNRPVVLDAKMWHGHPYASQVLDPRHTTLAKVSKKRERERERERDGKRAKGNGALLGGGRAARTTLTPYFPLFSTFTPKRTKGYNWQEPLGTGAWRIRHI